MNGVQDTLKDGLTTPTHEVPPNTPGVPQLDPQTLSTIIEKTPVFSLNAAALADGGKGGFAIRRRRRQEASLQSAGRGSSGAPVQTPGAAAAPASRSWGEKEREKEKDGQTQGAPQLQRSLSLSFSAGARRKKSVARLKDASAQFTGKQAVVFEPPSEEEK